MRAHRQDADAATRSSSSLPSALGPSGVLQILQDPPFAVVLDYDGTLAPIRMRPEDAHMAPSMRELLRQVAARCTVAVVSGRDLDNVREKVGIGSIAYAGSHGLDIQTPKGDRFAPKAARDCLDALDVAETKLREGVISSSARIERKRFSIAIHTRGIPRPEKTNADALVEDVLAKTAKLERRAGKEVIELRPQTGWGKGRAVEDLLDRLGFPAHRRPVAYVGDDLTDEDAFASPVVDAPVLVRERERDTHARFALSGPSEVEDLLEDLAHSAPA